MIRLLLVEQLYRAHTILKGESYHHDWVASGEWMASDSLVVRTHGHASP
jgi:hypothetical protein